MFKALYISVALLLVSSASTLLAQPQKTDPELLRLRQEYSQRFLEPGPHMQLAKYFREKGNLIQAFYILEAARRYRFDQETFDGAFLLHFGGFAPLDNSPAAEARYIELRKAAPNDLKLLRHLADIYISRSDYKRGEPLLLSAYEKDPADYRTLVALGEIYRRLGTPEKANRLVNLFLEKHSDSVGGYYFRLQSGSDSPAARALLADAIAKYPGEGYFWFLRGREAMRAKDLDEAERCLIKATVLDKNSLRIQAAAASFFRVERKDPRRAIGYYLNVYFLDPHAHFDGHAEARVAGLNIDIAKQVVERAIGDGKALAPLLGDPNPAIVGMAMTKLGEKWDSSMTDVFLALLRHDDTLVRWMTMLALIEKADRNLDPNIGNLLADPDARVRGLAAYMAVKLWKKESFPEVRKLLNEDAQILRFDAVSALMLFGGAEGRQLVVEHRRKEKNVYLNKLIDASLKENTGAADGMGKTDTTN